MNRNIQLGTVFLFTYFCALNSGVSNQCVNTQDDPASDGDLAFQLSSQPSSSHSQLTVDLPVNILQVGVIFSVVKETFDCICALTFCYGIGCLSFVIATD